MTYELQTSKGRVTWNGESGLAACHAWAESHPGESVFAWREIPHDLCFGLKKIVEPGD
jgi:hypothetical protein